MGRPQQPGADSVGTLDLLILSRLARGPMHGFGIAEYLHGVSDAFHVEEGSLYPALHRLEKLDGKCCRFAPRAALFPCALPYRKRDSARKPCTFRSAKVPEQWRCLPSPRSLRAKPR